VISVPASASTVQGYSASVVLDEAAWMPDAEDLWQALAPSITASAEHRISVLSTPRSKAGLFYHLWNRAVRGRWSRHRVTIDEAIAGGCRVDREELRAAISDEATWRTCYLCEFVDEQYSLLPFDLLQARTESDLPYHVDLSKIGSRGDLYGGFDVGRKHDLSVLALVEHPGTHYVSRGFVELQRSPFDEQERMLEAVLRHDNVHRLCIDASGIGLQLSERLRQRYGGRIEPVTISLPVKENLAARMLRVFQSGEIVIPDEQRLLTDLHSVEKQVTAAGNIRYAAPRSEGSHADRFTALSLALHAADNTYTGPVLTLIKPSTSGDAWSDPDGEPGWVTM
jgi:phage FluMu gp28-like protein